MKKVIFIILLAVSILSATAKNRALLIGVSNYKDDSWKSLSSENDIKLLTSALNQKFEITSILDRDASYQGILTSLQTLIDISSKGDTILIHFSGHGQQMVTDDPNEIDGLNEAFVPWDAFQKYQKGVYEGQAHLQDDILSSYIQKIRNKIGNGLVIISLDSCHSGNSDRAEDDDEIYRGTKEIFGFDQLSLDSKKTLSNKIYNTDYREIPKTGCEIIYISACKPWDVNKEMRDSKGQRYGSLSYCVANAISSTGLKDIKKWLDEIDRLMSIYAEDQTPMFTNSFGYEPNL